jgi:hypothetical protein
LKIFRSLLFLAMCFAFAYALAQSPPMPRPPVADYPASVSQRFGGTNAAYDNMKHVADDVALPATTTPVFAVTSGRIMFARRWFDCPNWGHVLVIEHQVPGGEPLNFIYGHLDPGTLRFVEGSDVEAGQQLGNIGHWVSPTTGLPCWGDHLHFGIRKGAFGHPVGTYPRWLVGYLAPSAFPGTYCDPMAYLTTAQCVKPFEFFMDSFAVDGNILGRGSVDGTSDFRDNFDDGSLMSPPTSAFFFAQGVNRTTESGGFLRFTSADGNRTVTRFGITFLEDIAFLNHLLTDGGGNSQITVAFRADVPSTGQYYGIGIQNAGSPLRESIAISVTTGNDGRPRVHVNDHTGAALASDFVLLPSGGFILLRLFVDDATNRVFASYSIDNGNTYRAFAQHGTIFNVTPGASVFAQGGIRVPIQQPQ